MKGLRLVEVLSVSSGHVLRLIVCSCWTEKASTHYKQTIREVCQLQEIIWTYLDLPTAQNVLPVHLIDSN